MTADHLPPQSPPVHRPDLVQPWTTLDLEHGEPREMVEKYVRLTHGANFNDPAAIAGEGAFVRARSHR